jgi:hypothetical protein
MTNTLSFQSRVTPGQFDRAKLAQIPCPNLRTLVNEGWLTPDANGLVDLKQLDQALKRIGVEGLPKRILVGGAQKATAEVVSQQFGDMATGKFNILKLTGSNLDHPGDTRILRGGFNAERLDWILSFANADGRLGMKELSRAQQQARNDEPTTFRDKALGVAELTALLKVYGTPDKNGDKTLSLEGVRSLYQHARFPEEWRARLQENEKLGAVSPQKTGLFRLIGGVVEMSFRQAGTTTGRAIDGMMMALGRDRQIDQTSAIGLGHGMCPAGPPASMSSAETRSNHSS